MNERAVQRWLVRDSTGVLRTLYAVTSLCYDLLTAALSRTLFGLLPRSVMDKPKDVIEEFTWVGYELFATYMDCMWGFSHVQKFAQDAIATDSHDGKPPYMTYKPANYIPGTQPDKMSIEQFDQQSIHNSPADQIVKRNDLTGKNTVVVARMTLITLYHYWEDVYRGKIAELLGLASKNDLLLDALGDIRHLRTSIVHHNSVALKDVERAKRFKWFKEGQSIQLSFNQMLEIKNYLMNDFGLECEAMRPRDSAK